MHYTVMVVEDEFEQRRALIERGDWASAGFEVIGEAENGVEALDQIEALEPDLIVTDIKMPMISGLELAARVRELRPATQIVILSGYDSFEYAQTAINYNIIRYLLKPISSAEMTDELHDIHRRMDDRLSAVPKPDPDAQAQLHRMKIDRFLLPLMLGSNEEQPDDRELRANAESLGIVRAGTSPRFAVLVSKYKDESGAHTTGAAHIDFIDGVLGRYLYAVSFIVYGRAVTLVATEEAGTMSNLLELPLREMVQTAKRMRKEKCTIGVSRSFTALSGCADAYLQAVTARRYTSDGAGEVRFIDDQERIGETEVDHVEKTAMKLEQLLKVGDRAALEDFIAQLFAHSTPENANLLVMQIIATVYRVVGSVADKTEAAHLLSGNPFFARMTAHNRNLLAAPAQWNIWRAPLDNDMYSVQEPIRMGYDRMKVKVYEMHAQREGDAVAVRAYLSLSAVAAARIAEVSVTYRIDGKGRMEVFGHMKKPFASLPDLPRFGLRFFLEAGMEQVSYLGYGPTESYADKHRATYLGRFYAKVSDLHEDYLKPQENGSHFGTREVTVSGLGAQICVRGAGFSFSASHFTQEELTRKKHNFELVPVRETVLCLDFAQAGVGSNSCGPELLPQYHVPAELDFACVIEI